MVRLISTVFLIASIAVSVIASPIEHRDVSLVKHDLQETSHAVSKLDGEISSLGNTFDIHQANAIRADVDELHRLIVQSTKDVMDVHGVSDNDGKAIFSEVKAFAPTITHLLNSIYAKKPAFFAFGRAIIPLIRDEIQSLHTASFDLGNALVDVAPKSIKADASNLKKAIDTAFDKVIAYYNQS